MVSRAGVILLVRDATARVCFDETRSFGRSAGGARQLCQEPMTDSLRVLVVEDRDADAELLLAELRRAGFLATWTRVDTEAAYLAALDSRPDVILADRRLARFDASRALHHLRAAGLDIPLIVVSDTVAGTPQAAALIEQGAADYVPKDGLGRLVRAVSAARESQALRELRESEERTRLILANALDAVVTIDIDGRIIAWSGQAEKLFGWSAADVLHRRLSETIIPAAYREAHERGLARFRETGEGPVLNRRIELSAVRRDGTEFRVELAPSTEGRSHPNRRCRVSLPRVHGSARGARRGGRRHGAEAGRGRARQIRGAAQSPPRDRPGDHRRGGARGDRRGGAPAVARPARCTTGHREHVRPGGRRGGVAGGGRAPPGPPRARRPLSARADG